jgi:hypothetical protein
MRRTGLAVLVALLALSACQSRLNPVNWFGNSREAPSLAPRGGYETETDPRPLVEQVTAMQVERVPGGAVVRATGLPPTQGFWAADLVPQTADYEGRPVPENGVATLEFRIVPPIAPQRSGPAQSREVTAAFFLSDQSLAGIRSIVVQGRTNSRSSSR